ncbi:MAG: DUF2179 domain-containing protein [Thermoflexales bacterium]|nr:DUF2179 domain-containing protein [Thermoflexales bacterium]
MHPILGGLFVFCLRLTDVTLGTLRILMTVRGRKLLAGAIGFVEVGIFAIAISQVVRNIDNLWNVLGYAGGFAAGTIVGMTIEERLALGFTIVRIISSEMGHDLAQAIRQLGFGATEMTGQGMNRAVNVLEVMVRRADLPAVLQIVDRVDNKAFVTVEEARRVYRGWRLSK